MQWMSSLFEQYGYFVLFIGLFLESIAIPFPGELAMAISGHMASLGTFHLGFIMLVSFLGATIGTTVSYALGKKLGPPFFKKYGRYLLLTEDRMNKITEWFGKYGNKIILVSYFIPGLRHFTGYVSGILHVRLRTFLLFSNLGAVVWVIMYVMVGHILGVHIERALHAVSKYSLLAVIGAALVIVCIVMIKKMIKKMKNKTFIHSDQ